MMKKLTSSLCLSLAAFAASAQPLNISFNNSLPVGRSAAYPGCETSAYGYTFDVTMLGYNLSKSTCTAANLFPITGYLTTGQMAPRGRGQLWMTAPAGTTFELVNFTIKNYSATNALYLDTTDAFGATNTTVLSPIGVGSKLYQFSGLTNLASMSIRSTNNRFDITAIQIVDSNP